MLERHGVGWGASGRNGGFVLPGFKPEPESLIRRFGMQRARGAVRGLAGGDRVSRAAGRRGRHRLRLRPLGHGDAGRTARPSAGAGAERQGAARAVRRTIPYCWGRRRCGRRSRPPTTTAGCSTPRPARCTRPAIVPGSRPRRFGPERESWRASPSKGCAAPPADGARYVGRAGRGGRGAGGHQRIHRPRLPRLRRRVVPVGSYIVATAPLGPALASRLIPRGRVMSDTWNLLHYFRLSGTAGWCSEGGPRSRRRRWGGAPGSSRQAMRRVFPALAAEPGRVRLDGKVAFARDRLPHAGRMDGIHYALAYGGHGVAFATWLGGPHGRRDRAAGRRSPSCRGLPAIPLYGGTPWFLPAVGGYYRLKDWLR